ncbi:MAG: NUDIX domain-containing protein [Verrucomicrobia bacterium]|nr:NUDIX domain-containing protein [Verrucomicrobiota bacterium]MCH8510551.1 NUDIX domain-containing protein [Kiritimatiellia bacterium]
MSEEWFDLVNEAGERVGRARRSECHGNPKLLHQAVHVFVVNAVGQLFLQKRSLRKDTQPGKWDTSVGGHVDAGEEPMAATRRELSEELGVAEGKPAFLYQYLWRCPFESELIRSYGFLHEGPFRLQAEEIDEGRFWTPQEIERNLGHGVFTDNFEYEWPRAKAALFPVP